MKKTKNQKKAARVLRKRLLMFVIILTMMISLYSIAARPSTVRIFALHYEEKNGKSEFSLVGSNTRLGYYPDYNIQPDKGFRLSILDKDSNALFNLRFYSPNYIYVHQYDDDKITGGLTILNETDFAMTLPTFENEDKILIFDEEGKEVFSHKIEREKEKKAFSSIIMFIVLLGILSIVFFAARKVRRKQY